MPKEVVSLGIDLGTTNCTLAYSAGEQPHVIEIAQVDKPGAVTAHAQMPSAVYISIPAEQSGEAFRLAWGNSPEHVVGRFARERAATAPDRVVLSAKSWLCNAQVDRKEAILPWNSEIAEQKISPFTASSLLLAHMRNAAESVLTNNPKLANVGVVITVPASFDEVARNLTVEAARDAGFEKVSLLEEPLAALYSWIARTGDGWREQISIGDVIVVCDVGGGTADFSLVLVGEQDRELTLERLSVGDHILLGGDNMDLALAYQLRKKLEADGNKLDTWQFHSLVHEARRVKERIMTQDDEILPVTLAGRGSSLFSSTLQVEAHRKEVLNLILDGFFPEIDFNELPQSGEEFGLEEFGLPFESEPALTKHLAQFLHNSNEQVAKIEKLPESVRVAASKNQLMPTAVLFNGGVFKSSLLRERTLKLLNTWSQAEEQNSVRELLGTDVDAAVAEGAAQYGQILLTGEGLRIRAGVPRSYYLGLKQSMPAVPGMQASINGICVVAQGAQEGTDFSLPGQKFSLVTGREVEFRFFSSQQRPDDQVGAVVNDAQSELTESTRLTATLPVVDGQEKTQSVPVELHSKITDVGTLELWMHALNTDDRWKLEFDVRAEKKTPQSSLRQ